MNIQELPVELLHEILHHAFKNRGLKRFMRLRLVSKTFAREVENALFVYRLLDQYLSEERRGFREGLLPAFTGLYLEHRVLHQAETDGYAHLITIRKVAETISQNPNDDGKQLGLHDVVKRLCSLILDHETSNDRLIHIFRKHLQSDHQRFSDHLMVAAVECRCMSILKQVAAGSDWLCTHTWLFGSPYRIAAIRGDQDMLRYLLSDATTPRHRLPKARDQAFIAAAIAGQVETIRFLFQLRREDIPWRFEDRQKGRSGTYDQPLSSAMTTPSKEVLDFVTSLQKEHSAKKSIWRTNEESLTHRLRRCAEEGWYDMAAHLLVQGAHPDGVRADIDSTFRPIIRACMRGHTEIVRLLLYYSADTSKALQMAALHGHLETVELLLKAGAATVGAVAEAASGGYWDVVQLLLDHGADIDDSRYRQHPLQVAFSRENLPMFDMLMQHGAILTDEILQECFKCTEAYGSLSLASICHHYKDGEIPRNIQVYLNAHSSIRSSDPKATLPHGSAS